MTTVEKESLGSPAVQAPVSRTRLLLAKWHEDDTPTVVAAIDETIWEHWDDEDEAAWVAEGKRRWGIDPTDCEWKQIWVTFPTAALAAAFATPSVQGAVALDTDDPLGSSPDSGSPARLREAAEASHE